MFSESKTFIRHVICKCFLPFLRVFFFFILVTMSYKKQMFLILIKSTFFSCGSYLRNVATSHK